MNIKLDLIAIYAVIASLTNSLMIESTDEKSCKCTTDQGKLDLSRIAKADGKSAAYQANFTIPGPQPINLLVYWNPCNDFTLAQASGQCNSIETCLNTADGYTSFGSKDDALFKVVGDHLQIAYGADDSSPLVVDLICKKSGADDFQITSFDSMDLTLQLESKYACIGGSGGISVGSVLCIIFAVLIIVYLIGGILIQKLVRKAEGTDVIPQKSLWIRLPRYVKDGFLFLIKCCKVSESGYEEF